MASLPSVVIGNAVKLQPDFKKHTAHLPPVEKRNYSSENLDRTILDFGEVEPSVYVPLLQKCVEKASIRETQMIHGHMMKNGIHEHLLIGTMLVNIYGKCGAMADARKVFDKLPVRNSVTWTSLMSGYLSNSQPELALHVFLELLQNGVYPTEYTIAIVLNSCRVLNDTRTGKEVHGYAVKYGLEEEGSVRLGLCYLYSNPSGSLDSAIEVFCRTRKRDVLLWTSVIAACKDHDDSETGLALFREMVEAGIMPNEFTLARVFSFCCTMQAINLGLQVHSLSIKLGYESNLAVTNAILFFYLKDGQISEAKKLLDGSENISLVTWNSLLSGHAQMMDMGENSLSAYRNGIEALEIFLRLKRSDFKPDDYSFSSVLKVCSKMLAVEQGQQVHAQTIKTGFLSDVVVGTALVDMYNKCGSIKSASKAFVEMPSRTSVSWTCIICAFAQHGRPPQALGLFEDMRLAGAIPNMVTFVCVLSACSHAGMVDKALAYLEMMKYKYKLKPVMDHYACITDMFVRLGRLDEAFEFVKQMELEPSEFIWSLLIAGCRSHGNLELGFYAAEQLLNLYPKDPETYAMLLNMYISAERWKDASRVRKMMRDEKLPKLKEWSWISVRGKVHSFKPDDRPSSQSEEVDKLLGDLLEKSRNLGYEWNGNLELAEEEEQAEDSRPSFSMVHHSEKLAVVFGLLNVPKPVPIRVNKSISMCRDCHNFIKLVSVLTEREIMVRDSKRLHRFVDGKCSCGDFGCLL